MDRDSTESLALFDIKNIKQQVAYNRVRDALACHIYLSPAQLKHLAKVAVDEYEAMINQIEDGKPS